MKTSIQHPVSSFRSNLLTAPNDLNAVHIIEDYLVRNMFGLFKSKKKRQIKSDFYLVKGSLGAAQALLNDEFDESEKNYLIDLSHSRIESRDEPKDHYILSFEDGKKYVLQYNAHPFHVDSSELSDLRFECAAEFRPETGELEQLDDRFDSLLISSLVDLFKRVMSSQSNP